MYNCTLFVYSVSNKLCAPSRALAGNSRKQSEAVEFFFRKPRFCPKIDDCPDSRNFSTMVCRTNAAKTDRATVSKMISFWYQEIISRMHACNWAWNLEIFRIWYINGTEQIQSSITITYKKCCTSKSVNFNWHGAWMLNKLWSSMSKHVVFKQRERRTKSVMSVFFLILYLLWFLFMLCFKVCKGRHGFRFLFVRYFRKALVWWYAFQMTRTPNVLVL